jgi:hypothetical protein
MSLSLRGKVEEEVDICIKRDVLNGCGSGITGPGTGMDIWNGN